METHSEIKKYIAMAWNPDDIVEIRCIPSRHSKWSKASELSTLFDWMAERNNDTNRDNIYAGIMPRKAAKGSTDDDCSSGNIIWADIDYCDEKEASTRFKASGLPPVTMAVNSGHGVHLYWRLDSAQEPAEIIRACQFVAERLNSDKSVCNPSRILRLPGFTNWKSEPVPCKIIKSCTKQYSISLFQGESKKTIQENKPQTADEKRAMAWLDKYPGASQGNRNYATFRAACAAVNDLALNLDLAESLVNRWNILKNNPPLDEKEVESAIKSALKHAKKARGCRAEEIMPDVTVQIQSDEQIIDGLFDKFSAEASGETSIPLPWPELTRQTGGLREGSLFVVGGPTKTGKSFFLMQIATSLTHAGKSWKYLPLEDTRSDFARRLLACEENDYSMISDNPSKADVRAEKLALQSDILKNHLVCVDENPRVGHKNKQGKTVVPRLRYDSVLSWAEKNASNRVLFIDPLAQIDFDLKNQQYEESDFIRQLLALAQDNKCTIILAAHAVKRRGRDAEMPLTEGDLQGAAAISRLSHCTLMLEAHDERKSEVIVPGGFDETWHNRTVYIPAARNGPGSRTRIAMSQMPIGPEFIERGLIIQKRRF